MGQMYFPGENTGGTNTNSNGCGCLIFLLLILVIGIISFFIYKNNSEISIAKDEIEIGSSADDYYVNVYSNRDWHIYSSPAVWVSATKSGDQIHINVNSNTSSEVRQTYVDVECTFGRRDRIYITQSPKITVEKVDVKHNVWENGEKGMRIDVTFSVPGMKDKWCYMFVNFYNENGSPLKDKNGLYSNSKGNVEIYRLFTPGYALTSYTDFSVFIPHKELHLTGDASCYFTLSFTHNNKILTTWKKYSFTYSSK